MDTNRVALKIVEEEVNGVIPENPAFVELRNTGSPGFGYNPSTIVSNEIRPDRQVADITTVGAEPGGEVDGELSFGTYDSVFEGAFQQRWKKTAEVAGANITSFTADTNIIVVANPPETIVVGSLLMITGTASNNGIKKVKTVEGTSIGTEEALVTEESVDAGAKIKVIGWEAPAGDIQAATSDSEKSLTSTTSDLTKLGLLPGQWFKIGDSSLTASSFDTVADNGFARVESVATNKIVFGFAPKGWANDTADAKTIRIYFGDMLVNSEKEIDPTKPIEIISYTIEQSFLDHNPIDYQYVSYMIPDTLTLSMSAADFITINTSFVGADAQASTERVAGATDVAAPQYPVMNTTSNVAQIARGDAKIEGANYVNELTVEINNNSRRRTAVGIFGAWSVGVGEFAVTGSMSTYFSNADLLQDLINNRETSLNFVVRDNDNHAYFFDMPRVKYSSGNPEVSGKNEDVMLPLEYQAIRDPDLGYTLSLGRFEYLN